MAENTIELLVTYPFSENLISSLREVSPRLRITYQPVRRLEEISTEIWQRTEIMYADRVLPDPALVPNLKWVQFHYAGIDFALASALLQKQDVIVTTMSGANAPQAAEFAVTMMLALGHKMPELFANQNKAEWPRDRWDRFAPKEINGSTVGLVGYGSIGREIARLVRAFGATVIAAKRDAMHPTDEGYYVPGRGDPGGDLFDRLYPVQALKSMLKECDFVVVTLPLTNETRRLVSTQELAAMKSTAFLIDISRGGIVDHSALLEALQERKLAGAALDVAAEEPLPPSSPFWRMSNVIVTPHIAGISPQYQMRAIRMFTENLRRYFDHLPLLNRIDIQKGY